MQNPLGRTVMMMLLVATSARCTKQASGVQNPSTAKQELAGGTFMTPTVVLLDAGSEPRRELRYSLRQGERRTIALELMMALEATTGATVAELQSPPMKLVVEAGPHQLLGKGRMRYDIRVRDAQVEFPAGTKEADRQAVEAELAPIRRIRGWVEVDDRGLTHAAHFDVPNEVHPRTATLLGNIRSSLVAVPFPQEEVGVGARWKAVRTLDLDAMKVQQEVTYTLSSMAAQSGRLAVVLRQSAAPQALPNAEPGVAARLEAYETAGIGAVEYDLQRLTPWSEVDSTTQMRATLKRDDQVMPLEMRMRLGVQVASKTSP